MLQCLLELLLYQNIGSAMRKYRHRPSVIYHFADESAVSPPLAKNGTLDKIKQNVSEMQPFVLLGVCLGVVLIITVIVVVCCRKYHTRQLYQQSPENFSSKPNLSLPQLWRFEHKIRSLTPEQGQVIASKETYDGKFIEVTFKTHSNCIYFPVQQKSDCYFEIELMKLSSNVQIGFVHTEDVGLICKKSSNLYSIDMDQYGVSVRTDGSTYIYGNNQINFQWKIEYGDTIGIGMTKHEGGRRVWITRNGIIQNPPSEQEMIKFIDVKNEGVDQTTVKKQKSEELEEASDKKIKDEALMAKRRIEIKTSRKFSYYAVVVSESGSQPRKDTIVNWNVGGQNFRLYDAKQLVGLLG